MKLVVVESPAKAKTIEKYLGSGHRVLASFGHVRDLPPKDGSVNPDADFAMEWETYPDKAKQLKAITDEAKKADALILATDPDREGEAISWHLREVLKPKVPIRRIEFHEITEEAVRRVPDLEAYLDHAPVHVGEPAHGVHHLRTGAEAFRLDLVDGVEIDGLCWFPFVDSCEM